MANLFWKRRSRELVNLASKPFASEEEFERTVFETKGLLEDVYLLKRQVRGGRKPGIPDMIGIDNDGNVCIVEMKNVPVDASILSQVLEYAFWAESNPDSIESLWLGLDSPPDGVEMAFESYEVRIIIIAPRIDRSTLSLVGKINYPVDLMEVTRWADDESEFLLVDRLEPSAPLRTRPAQGLAVYNREFYESHRNKDSVQHFLDYVERTHAFVLKLGYSLEPKFNKHYCGFKLGYFNAFGIKWIGTKSFAFFFKLPEEVAQGLAPNGVPMTRYESEWKEAIFRIEPGKTMVDPFGALFRGSVDALTGK